MVTIFNRTELFVTMSMNVQANIRDALADAGIDYSVTCKSNIDRGRQIPFSNLMNDMNYTYYIYVRKKDLEQAQLALRGVNLRG